MNTYKEFASDLNKYNNIVYFTGAGVSVDSGVSDFRSENGIYTRAKGKTPYKPEEMISKKVFERDPEAHYKFFWEYLYAPDLKPNLGHTFMADLEKRDKNVSVVTQNADGLHQKAGSSKVYNLHGNGNELMCTKCGKKYYSLDEVNIDEKKIPRCPKDNGIVRICIVLFGEALDDDVVQGAAKAISEAEMLIVAGTSLKVQPAASLLNVFQGDVIAMINPKRQLVKFNGKLLEFQEGVTEVFTEVKKYM